LYVASF